MSKELSNQVFDYSAFDKETKGKLIWYAAEIRKHGKSHVEAGLAMGKMLSEARELCGEEPFYEWAPVECGCSLRTAYNYMSAFSEFGQCANSAQIELSAMYELTKNESAKKKALKLAAKGIKVTYSMARELIEGLGKLKPSTVSGWPKTTLDEREPKTEPAETAQSPPDTAVYAGPEEVNEEDYAISGPDRWIDKPREPGITAKDKPSSPPKQFDRASWFKQWEQSIGPLVRLVDKIAQNVGESKSESHRTVQDHLNIATEEMMEWMGVKK